MRTQAKNAIDRNVIMSQLQIELAPTPATSSRISIPEFVIKLLDLSNVNRRKCDALGSNKCHENV